MKTKKTILLATVLWCMPTCLIMAQDAKTDSIPSTREERNRNVMLNASSDVQPRQISIGLPAKFTTFIFEDGLPVSYCYWPILPYTSWHSGVSQSSSSLMSLGESALQYGSLE